MRPELPADPGGRTRPIMTDAGKGCLLMAGATLAWGSSYLFMQRALTGVAPFELIFLRFGIGFLAAGAICFSSLRKPCPRGLLGSAAILGLLLSVCFYAVMRGLRHTGTGMAGLLLGSAVIFVQLEQLLLDHEKPSPRILGAAALAFGGICMMSGWSGQHWGAGEWLCLTSAFGYSFHITLSGKFLRKYPPLPLGIWQLGFTALFAVPGMLLWETPTVSKDLAEWEAILMLGLICSAGGFLLQSLAQAKVDASQAGIIYALEPVFALVLGISVLHEAFSPRAGLGVVAILLGVVIAAAKKTRKKEILRPQPVQYTVKGNKMSKERETHSEKSP